MHCEPEARQLETRRRGENLNATLDEVQEQHTHIARTIYTCVILSSGCVYIVARTVRDSHQISDKVCCDSATRPQPTYKIIATVESPSRVYRCSVD